MKLKELCEAYRDNHIDLKNTSFTLYEIAERQFSRWLGRPAELTDLTKANLVAWMRSLRESGRAGITVNGKRNHVLALWNFAADEGLIDPPPRKIPKASEERPLPNSWSTPQLEQILQAAANAPDRDGWGPVEWTALILTASASCAKHSEHC